MKKGYGIIAAVILIITVFSLLYVFISFGPPGDCKVFSKEITSQEYQKHQEKLTNINNAQSAGLKVSRVDTAFDFLIGSTDNDKDRKVLFDQWCKSMVGVIKKFSLQLKELENSLSSSEKDRLTVKQIEEKWNKRVMGLRKVQKEWKDTESLSLEKYRTFRKMLVRR